jgi:outer membrane lipoprotein-sorting protein
VTRASKATIWAPVGIALIVIAAVLLTPSRAVSGPDLPEVTPDELLASMAIALSEEPSVSGEAVAAFDLGLPELPGDEDPLGDLAGDKRLRVWRSPDGFRLAELGRTWERSLTRSGEDLWIWDSRSMTARHLTVSSHEDLEPEPPADPLAMAAEALAALDESTEVTVGTSGRVAGRDVYTLVFRPRTNRTLVDRVEISVDAEARLPLQVAVFARGAGAPAIVGAYTEVSFAPIDPDVFRFQPPPGSTVEEETDHEEKGPRASRRDGPPLRKLGEGWASVLALPWEGDHQAVEGVLPYSGNLLSARLVDGSGGRWLMIGMVPQEVLVEEAAALR